MQHMFAKTKKRLRSKNFVLFYFTLTLLYYM